MIHLHNKAKEISTTLKREGFNGVQFEIARANKGCLLEDFDGDTNALDIHRRDHVTMNILPYFPSIVIEDHPYLDAEISYDMTRFNADFVDYLKSQFGKGVEVTYISTCQEVEAYRVSK